MPERTYMKVDPRRDHSFVIPRPDLSRTFGTPNAWAAEIMDKWYGTDWRIRQSPTRSQRAANGNQTAIEALRGLANDQDQAGIVSGSAIVRIGRLGSVGLAADILTASADADPLVRLGAAEAAANLPPVHRLEAIGDLLSDEIRALRIAAATALCSTSPDLFGNQRESFEKAAEDLRTYVDTNADVAETQSNFGFFPFGQQRISEAEAAFQRAISLDPALDGSRVNLAEFYRATGRNDKSEQTYAEAISISPERVDLRYGHALSLVREKALTGAIAELEEAVRLDAGNSRYKTTLAVALDSVGRTQEALDKLDTWAAASSDADIIGLALQYSLKLQRLPDALKFAERMAQLRPQNQKISNLLRQLRQAGNLK